jgi:hypothetical protein
VLAARAGGTVDGLELASRPRGVTVAWTESWNDAAGAYHARAMTADLGGARRVRPHALSAPTDIASSLALAGDGNGDEVAAWNACSATSQVCMIQSRARRARWFGAPSQLGQIDPGQSPQLTMASNRKSLIGWITGGRVVLAATRRAGTHFGSPRSMSGGLADNLALGAGPAGEVIASWSEGTFAPAVFAAVSR